MAGVYGGMLPEQFVKISLQLVHSDLNHVSGVMLGSQFTGFSDRQSPFTVNNTMQSQFTANCLFTDHEKFKMLITNHRKIKMPMTCHENKYIYPTKVCHNIKNTFLLYLFLK